MPLESEVALSFSPKKQLAILGHLLCDEKFFLFAKDIVKPNWFTDTIVGKAYKAKQDRFEKYRRHITAQEVVDSPEIVAEGQQVRTAVQTQVNEALRAKEIYPLDAISVELTQWYHSQLFFESFTKAHKFYNSHREEESYRIIEEAVKEIRNSTFGNDVAESFDSFAQDMENLKLERANALTTGLTLLDELLLPPAKDERLGGALLPGDTTIIMAPVNTGKTTTCINFIKPNILTGKHVLFLTHEGRPADIKKKIWCAMLGVTEVGLMELQTTAAGCSRMELARQYLSRFLTYIPLNKAGQRVEDVVSTIRRKQEELMSKNNGVGYAMLVDDYPALLTCDQAKQGQLAKRNIDDIVYGNFVQLGLEYKMHVVAAIQVNREGSKINKNAGGDNYKPLLTMENVAESFSVMMQATNVITLNRDTEDKSRNRMTMYLDKSRSSETGYAVVCNTNFGCAQTHSNELGAAYYRGATTMSDKIDDLLKQYKNDPKGIPDTAWGIQTST